MIYDNFNKEFAFIFPPQNTAHPKPDTRTNTLAHTYTNTQLLICSIPWHSTFSQCCPLIIVYALLYLYVFYFVLFVLFHLPIWYFILFLYIVEIQYFHRRQQTPYGTMHMQQWAHGIAWKIKMTTTKKLHK